MYDIMMVTVDVKVKTVHLAEGERVIGYTSYKKGYGSYKDFKLIIGRLI